MRMKFFDLDSALLRHHPLCEYYHNNIIIIIGPKLKNLYYSLLERMQYIQTTPNDKITAMNTIMTYCSNNLLKGQSPSARACKLSHATCLKSLTVEI